MSDLADILPWCRYSGAQYPLYEKPMVRHIIFIKIEERKYQKQINVFSKF